MPCIVGGSFHRVYDDSLCHVTLIGHFVMNIRVVAVCVTFGWSDCCASPLT